METVTVNKAGIGELFGFAKDNYGMQWNDCVRLFKKAELLPFNQVSCFDFEMLEENDTEVATREVKYSPGLSDLECYNMGATIIYKFLQHHNVTSVEIK
jgi:hypothetical protein